MKIFRIKSTYTFPSIKNLEYLGFYDHRRIEIARMIDDEILYFYDRDQIFQRTINVNNVIYRLNSNTNPDQDNLIECFLSGKCVLITDGGEKSEFDSYAQALLWSGPELIMGEFTFTTDSVTRKKMSVIKVGLKKKYCKSIELDSGFTKIFLVNMIVWSNTKGLIICCDDEPSEVWRISFDRIFLTRNHGKYDPVLSAKNLIFNHGATKSERLRIQDDYSHSDNNYYFDSLMACYHIDTGEKRWEHSFDEEVNDYIILGENLFVATNDKLHVINASTGQSITTIETMYSSVFNPEFNKNHLVIINNKLLFTHGHDRKINIYDTDSLNLDRVIELPSPWRVNITGESFYHDHTDRLYIRLESSNNERERYAYLQIDPNRLDAMVEIEKAPEFHIDIVEKGAHKEVLLECSDQNFSDVMRYLDIHARNAAYEHGVSITKRFDCTAGFNGNILFNYHYKGDDVADAQEKLDTICARFNEDADVYSLLAADRSKNCQLVGKVMPAES